MMCGKTTIQINRPDSCVRSCLGHQVVSAELLLLTCWLISLWHTVWKCWHDTHKTYTLKLKLRGLQLLRQHFELQWQDRKRERSSRRLIREQRESERKLAATDFQQIVWVLMRDRVVQLHPRSVSVHASKSTDAFMAANNDHCSVI